MKLSLSVLNRTVCNLPLAQVFNYDFAALVLYDAAVFGDRFATEKYGITKRSISRYRKRLQTDPILSQKVFELRKGIVPPKTSAQDAMDAALEFIQDAPKHLERGRVQDLLAVAQTYKTIAEIELAGKIIDARLAQIPGQLGTADRQMATGTVETTAERVEG